MSSLPMNRYDPFSAEVKFLGTIATIKELERTSKALCDEIERRNIGAGKPQDEIYSVCAIHRAKGIHRWFNLSPEYEGRLGHAEALIDQWRVASPDEEKACKLKDEQERLARLKAVADRAAVEARFAMTNSAIVAEAVAVLASSAEKTSKGK